LQEKRDLAAQYLLLYEFSLPFGLDLNNQINVSKSETRFIVTLESVSTQEQLALVCAKNHWHGSLNPMAQYKQDMTIDEVLADKPIAYPLTRAMCAPVGDGAAAAIVCSEAYLKKLADARPIRICASVLGSGTDRDLDGEDIGERLSKQAYEVAGVGPRDIDAVYGITKAYTTRVGAGPFPTELTDEIGDRLQEVGCEFGATTGRRRRCGWLDAVALRHTARLNSLSGLIVTKLDVLSGIDPIRICTSYTIDSQEHTDFPADTRSLERVVPAYIEVPGWTEDISGVRSFGDLPENARRYIKTIEELLEVPAAIVSVGPDRAQTVIIDHPFGSGS
jgi:hypothetical protein